MDATLLFHGELAGLLHHPAAAGRVAYPVTRRASIKDVIEALGPPHTEVYALTADGREADFSLLLLPGMTVTVHPAACPVDVTIPSRLRPSPLPRLAFAADANVGRLATLLRLLGYDTTYDQTVSDPELAAQAAAEGRVVLSRDRSCLKRSEIVYGRLVRANDPLEQVRDSIQVFGLDRFLAPFSRCLRCNRPLEAVDKGMILDMLQPKTKRYYDHFSRCPHCGRIYWAGSHYDGMRDLLKKLGITAPLPPR